MRYAALVTTAEPARIGQYDLLPPDARRVEARLPSLKGVWYRGHCLHDGSAAGLEEMFDPDRLKETHVPGGWSPPGTTTLDRDRLEPVVGTDDHSVTHIIYRVTIPNSTLTGRHRSPHHPHGLTRVENRAVW
jgi:hypothetical protein